MKVFNADASQTRVIALVYALFGILLCFFSKGILLNGTRIIGGLVCLYGAFELFQYFTRRQSIDSSALYIGLPAVLFGLVFLVSPESLLAIIPVLGGVVMILNAVVQMQRSFVLKDYGWPSWPWAFIASLVLLIAGVVVLLKPIQSLSFILQLIGGFLLVNAAVMLFNLYELKKYVKR